MKYIISDHTTIFSEEMFSVSYATLKVAYEINTMGQTYKSLIS